MRICSSLLKYKLKFAINQNQTSSRSKKLILTLSQSTPQCASADFTRATPCTWSARRRRSLCWWDFVRRSLRGSGARQHSLAEIALFSTIFGKLTQKTFARVRGQLMESSILLTRDPWILALSARPLLMVEIRTVSSTSMPDMPTSRKRGKAVYKYGST